MKMDQRKGRVQRGLGNVNITSLIDLGVVAPEACGAIQMQIDFAPITPEAYNAKRLFKYPPEEPHFVDHFYESYRMYRLTGLDVLKCLKLLRSLQITSENLRKFYLSTGRIPSQDEADIISIAGVEKLISIINK
jgi:hypothetical protein